MPSCALVLPGDWHTPTGGYRYDRRIVAGLRGMGWRVGLTVLDESFPWPSAPALAHAEAAIAALPDGALVVADGLAFGAMPDIAERHASRLCWVALVHHPLWLETGLDAARQVALLDSERRACAVARRVVVTSEATAALLARLEVPASRIAVIEPGCDPAPVTAVRSHDERAARDGVRLLCVATLTPRKGHLVLIEALGGLRERAWTLHCVGSLSRDPSTTQAVRDAVIEHGLQGRVHLHGEVDDAALESWYASADVVAMPSHFEGYGMVFAEALAHGLPVVGTATGAAAQLVATDAGVLVPPGDVAALRSVLAELIDDPVLRSRLTAGARAARARLPTWPAACERFAAVLGAAAADARA